MKHSTPTIKQQKLRQTLLHQRYLRRYRANLQHLIYSMEHGYGLNASEAKISSLKELLTGIEHQMRPN
ncbi:MAG: hypothetical protein HYR76_10875 [Ignavibacteria bacterium]|nr:hypothetical protein [Ignavibacteria bacterium]MBI3766826.1 hypothetical protein [Ignavibacteriales bacterium]